MAKSGRIGAGDQGLPPNPGAAHALMSHAASLGDPEAQRNRGIALAAGIHPPAANSTHKCEPSHWSPTLPRLVDYECIS